MWAVVANAFFNERDLDEMYVTRKNPKQPHHLGTIIDNYALDHFYKYHSYLHLSHRNSTYYRVIQTLYRVCGRLNINKIVQARAITLYFKLIRNLDSKRPNYFRIMVAALALALRENDISIPLTEVRKAFLKGFDKMRIIQFRLKLIGIIISLSLSVSCHILCYISLYEKIDENALIIFFSLILSISYFHILKVFEEEYYNVFSETVFGNIIFFSPYFSQVFSFLTIFQFEHYIRNLPVHCIA